MSNAERIADGQHQIANLQRIGVGELQGGKCLAVSLDPQHGDIGLLILKDDLGVELPTVGQGNTNLCGLAAADDVIIGDDDAIRADDHARAQRVLDPLSRHAEPIAEEAAEEGVVEQRRNAGSHTAPHIDVDDGRSGALHNGRIGILNSFARGRRHAYLCFGYIRAHREARQNCKSQNCHPRPNGPMAMCH